MIKPEHTQLRSFDANISRQTREFLDSSPIGLSVGGEETPSVAGKRDPNAYPATGEYIARVHRASSVDVRSDTDTARRAFDEGDWSRFAPAVREKVQPAC